MPKTTGGTVVYYALMAGSEAAGITLLLRRWSNGDASALAEITPLVYQELRSLAGNYLRRERPGHTLQPTALIHEAYIRLIDQRQTFESRRQFYGVAAHLMRMILVDHARSRRASKRGGQAGRIPLENSTAVAEQRGIDLLALDEALDRLSALDERKARAVELRYFGGLRTDEISDLLGVSAVTVGRELRFAENWLCGQLNKRRET